MARTPQRTLRQNFRVTAGDVIVGESGAGLALQGGEAAPGGAGAPVTITAGTATGAALGGSVTLVAGSSVSGTPGDVVLTPAVQGGSTGQVVLTRGGLQLAARATAPGPAIDSSQGRLWVRNDPISSLVFTDGSNYSTSLGLHAPERGVFSVLEYGASMDPLNDSRQAFQDACDACEAAGGGTVLVPPVLNTATQAYRCTGTVTIGAGVTVAGLGPRSIVRGRPTSSTTAAFQFAPGANRGGLRDLVLLGDDATPLGIGISFTGSQFNNVQFVQVWDYEVGVDVSDGVTPFSAYNTLLQAEVNRSTVIGIRCYQNANGVTILGGRVFYTFDGANGGVALDVQDARALSIQGLSLEAYDIGLRLAGASSGSMTGTWMEKGNNDPPGTDRVDFVIDGFEESPFFEGGWEFSGNHYTDTWPLRSTPLSVHEFGALGDGSTDDTVAVQAALTAAQPGNQVYFPRGTYLCGNLQVSGKTRVTIAGDGATIQWTGTGAIGMELVGTCTDVRISGLRFSGDGIVANGHRGIYSASGQTLTRIIIEDCVVQDCMIGISLNADLSGSIRDCIVQNNRIDNVVGTSSGQGYGIHVADGTGEHHGTLITGNSVSRAHRHSIYVARGFGCRVTNNVIDLHRTGDSTGTTLGAIVVARGGDHSLVGNLIKRSNNVGLFMDSGSTGGEFLRNVTVTANVFAAPVGIHPHLYVGEDITPDGDINTITIEGNTFDSDAWNIQAIRVNWGHGVTISGNVIRMRNVTAASYGIHLIGRGESAASATFSSRWVVSANQVQITDGGGGSASAGIRLVTPFTDASTIDLRCHANAFIVPGTAFSVGSSISNPNVTSGDQPTTGLSFVSGTLQLGYPEAATSQQVSGDLTLTGSASTVVIGDPNVAGNAQIQFRKGDANNQSFLEWRVGTATTARRWQIQHDTSENLNLLTYDTSGVLHSIIPFSWRYSTTSGRVVTSIDRLATDRATSLVNGNITLSSTWGDTAIISLASRSNEHRGEITITAQGTGIGANPTITVTFPDGGWTNSGFTVVQRNGGTDTLILTPGVHFTVTDSTTTFVIAVTGGLTPVPGSTVTFRWMKMG